MTPTNAGPAGICNQCGEPFGEHSCVPIPSCIHVGQFPADDVREALSRVLADHYYIERWSGGEASCTCRQWVESVQRKPYTTWAQHVADAIITAEVRNAAH